MLNQVILVGKVVEKGETTVIIQVKRTFDQHEKEFDTIALNLSDGLIEQSLIYLKEGSTIGAKCYIKETDGVLTLEVEKITFIQTKK